MTGLLHLPGDRERAAFIELGERDDPRFIIPLVYGEMQGLQFRRVSPAATWNGPR